MDKIKNIFEWDSTDDSSSSDEAANAKRSSRKRQGEPRHGSGPAKRRPKKTGEGSPTVLPKLGKQSVASKVDNAVNGKLKRKGNGNKVESPTLAVIPTKRPRKPTTSPTQLPEATGTSNVATDKKAGKSPGSRPSKGRRVGPTQQVEQLFNWDEDLSDTDERNTLSESGWTTDWSPSTREHERGGLSDFGKTSNKGRRGTIADPVNKIFSNWKKKAGVKGSKKSPSARGKVRESVLQRAAESDSVSEAAQAGEEDQPAAGSTGSQKGDEETKTPVKKPAKGGCLACCNKQSDSDDEDEEEEEDDEETGDAATDEARAMAKAKAAAAQAREQEREERRRAAEEDAYLQTLLHEDGLIDPNKWKTLTQEQQGRMQELGQQRHYSEYQNQSRIMSISQSREFLDEEEDFEAALVAAAEEERQRRLDRKIEKDWGDMTRAELRKYVVSVFFNIIFSHPGLLTVLLIYSLIGAYIFPTLESSHEKDFKKAIAQHRTRISDSLLEIHMKYRHDADYKKMVFMYVNSFRGRIVNSLSSGITTHSTYFLWSSWGALFYVATVYTTIGYGNIAPLTKAGRIATVIYGMFGIPLFLLVMVNFGTTLKGLIQIMWGNVVRLSKHARREHWIPSDEADSESASLKDVEVSEDDHASESLPPIVAVVVVLVHILVGTFMYTRWETWNVPQAFYFIFISFSTIGFGDVVPSKPKLFVISFIYLLLGLSLISMMISVLAESTSSKPKDETKPDEMEEVVVM